MITYTVYEPPEAPADRFDRAESLEFVKEGFSWAAMAITPIWMVANKLWLMLLFYLSAVALVQAGIWSFKFEQHVLSYALTALHLVIGYEADTLKRWTLERNGWSLLGSVNGRNHEACERRFLENWLPRQPYVRPSSLSQSQLASQSEPVSIGGRAAPPTGSVGRPSWRSAFGRRF